MIRSSIIFHTFGVRELTNVQQSAFVTDNHILIMAKIGCIMATAHYDKLEADRQRDARVWLSEDS